MTKRNSYLASFLLIVLCVFLLDQFTKYLAESFLATRGSVSVLRSVFHLTLVHNVGAAFGLFKGATFFFIAVTFLCLLAVILLLNDNRFVKKILPLDPANRWVRLALSLITAGACGNLWDRLRFSYVIDFLDFRIWPVFNVADSAITIGGILLFFLMIKNK